MILSNTEILKCIGNGLFSIDPLRSTDPAKAPFNTSAIDLHLWDELSVLDGSSPVQLDLSKTGIAQFWARHSKSIKITNEQPYSLRQGQLILARTVEIVDFPLNGTEISYSARVEGRSSLARCGILVHFTAPTIHAGFSGSVTLEIINLGPHHFLLTPDMAVCQLIIEEVKGSPANAPNQFKGQTNPVGPI